MAAVEERHWWYGGMRAIAAALLDEAYRGRHDLHILDAGCGTGGNARFLRRYGTVVGIDLAAEALELGGERLPGVLARASVLDIPFADARFDLVTSFDVLYHRAVPDEGRALRETARVLRPNGRFAVSDVIADEDMDEATRADMVAWTGCVAGALTRAEYAGALSDAGLVDVEVIETHRVHEHAASAIIRARKP